MQGAAEPFDLGRDHIHADAPARLLSNRACGGEPGLEDELHRILIAQGLGRCDQAQSPPLVPDRLQVHSPAVVRQAHHDLGAFAVQLENDAAGFRLAAPQALLGLLDPVHDSVAQHVLEGRQHALEHLPIELAGGAFDDQLGALAGFRGRLPHDARETLHVALERHHARAHQAVLQLSDRARLMLQQVLGLLREVLEQLLDARHVVGGLGKGARELLNGRIAVQLERIELAAVAALVLVPMQDLRLGLDFQAAQLLLQTGHRARQLAEVEVNGAELLLEACACDARFAGDVEQLIQQVRVHARHFLALGRGHRLAAGGNWLRREETFLGRARLGGPAEGDGNALCIRLRLPGLQRRRRRFGLRSQQLALDRVGRGFICLLSGPARLSQLIVKRRQGRLLEVGV